MLTQRRQSFQCDLTVFQKCAMHLEPNLPKEIWMARKLQSRQLSKRVGEVYFSDYPPNYWRRRQEHLRSTVEKEGPSDQCFGFWVTSRRREYPYTWNCQECISLFLHGTNAVQRGHIHDAGQSRDEGAIIIMHKAGGEVDYFPQNMEYTGEGAWTFGYCWSWAWRKTL